MERTVLVAQLEAAKRKARLGQDQIDRQQRTVVTLFAAGSETAEAENRLHVLERLHDHYLADISRIQNTLDMTRIR